MTEYLHINSVDEIEMTEDLIKDKDRVMEEIQRFIHYGMKTGLLQGKRIFIKTEGSDTIYNNLLFCSVHLIGDMTIKNKHFKVEKYSRFSPSSISFRYIEKIWIDETLIFDNGIERYWDYLGDKHMQIQIPFHYKAKIIELDINKEEALDRMKNKELERWKNASK